MLVQELSFGTKGASAVTSANKFFLSLGNQQESYQDWDRRTLAEKILATPIVLAASKVIKESISSLPFLTFKADDESKKETTSKYPFLINPTPGRDFGTLIEALVTNYIATGEMMLQVTRIGKRVIAFDIFPSYQIFDDVNSYKFEGNVLVGFYGNASYFGSRVYFPLFNKKASSPPGSELVYAYEYDLFNAYRGKSVLSGAKEVIQQIHNIYAYNKNSFGNGGNPSLIFTVPSVYEQDEYDVDGNKISKFNRFLTQMRNMFSGTKNARTVAVLNEDVGIKEFGFKPSEMNFKNALEQAENTLLKVLNVPTGIIGDISSQNYNTLAIQTRNFWELAVFPLLSMLEAMFTQFLEEGEVFRFDRSKIVSLQEDYERGASVWANAYREGVISEEEYREKIGFEAKRKGGKVKHKGFEDLDEDDILWKRLDDFAMDYADIETQRYDKIFEKQSKGIVNQIIKTRKALETTDVNTLNLDALVSALEVGLEATAVEVLREGYANFRREIELAGGSISLPQAGVAEYVGERLGLARGIAETVRENIRVALAEGVEAIETVPQLAERLTAIIHDEVRARRIARTEVANAYNHSRWLGMQENGFKHKMWLSKRDNKVRTEHRALDSQIRKVDETFSNGLQYPSEINCRCYIKAHRIRT